MKKVLFLALLIGGLCRWGIAQPLNKARLDSFFTVLEVNNKFMGSVAVSKDGNLIYSKSVGYSNFENKTRADKNSKYRIGSISKTFTTVLILKAVEEKKLKLDQTIDQYFPEIKNAGKITIYHMLGHKSGVHSFTNDADYLSWHTQSKTEKEMIDIIAKGGSDFEPGSKFEYSNSNFVLLTYILQKVLKESYGNILKKYIVQPLNLQHTYLGGKIDPVKGECKSYRFTTAWLTEPETDISIPLGAGGMVSTPTDLVKFSEALFGGKILKPESIALMKSVKDGHGIGLFQVPFYDMLGYGHTGGIDGFSSVFYYFPDGKVSYALTSNGTSFSNNDITIAVLSAVYNKSYDLPVFSGYEVSAEDLDAYSGTYSSTQVPLKITITRNNKTLIAQATGQSSFPLKATSKDKFKFEQAGIILEFTPATKSMLLIQGGGQFTFTKE